jgi:hypothetical protein
MQLLKQTDSKKVSILLVFYLLEEIKRITRLLLVLAGASVAVAFIFKKNDHELFIS